MSTQRTFRIPDATLARLAALAKHQNPDRPNATATLCRVILEAHRAAGLPEPGEGEGEPDRIVELDEEAAAPATGGKVPAARGGRTSKR